MYFFCIGGHVYGCVCVQVCVPLSEREYVQARDQCWLSFSISLNHFCLFVFVCLFQTVSLNPELTDSSGLPANFRDPSVSPPSAGTAGMPPPHPHLALHAGPWNLNSDPQALRTHALLAEASFPCSTSGVSTTLVSTCGYSLNISPPS